MKASSAKENNTNLIESSSSSRQRQHYDQKRRGWHRVFWKLLAILCPLLVLTLTAKFLCREASQAIQSLEELVSDIAPLIAGGVKWIGGHFFEFTNLIVSTYLAFLALRFTARPRIIITFLGEEGSGRKTPFYCTEKVILKFEFKNIGHWYAKPAAIENNFFLNFHPFIEPRLARYGAALQRVEKHVFPGKGGSKYFWIKGIHLYYEEPPEYVLVKLRMPELPGSYDCWVTGVSREGDHNLFRFSLAVMKQHDLRVP